MKQTILYVDDELDNLNVFKSLFRHDYNVIVAEIPSQGLNYLRETSIDLVISDFKMPETNGVDYLAAIAVEFPDVSRILLTAFDDTDTILKSINQSHVFAFATKPWKKEELKFLIDNALVHSGLKKENVELIGQLKSSNDQLQSTLKQNEDLRKLLDTENKYLKKEIEEFTGGGIMIGSSQALKDVQYNIARVAKFDTTILIQGQTGTGKELVARSIHKFSHRSDAAFIRINCASLPVTLVESELFGHEKGAFTGAHQSKPGLFELANEGTIFLDEIGELPLEVQSKFLRVLQEGEFYRIGGLKPIKVNVRILAATNRILDEEVKKGTFRADLYYRLSVFVIKVPPLKDRPSDIPELVDFIVKKYQRKLGVAISKISDNTIHTLTQYSWPGNVRELETIIERAVILSNNGALEVKLTTKVNNNVGDEKSSDSFISLQEMEKQYITRVLTNTNWKISGHGGAAGVLKVNHNTLRTKMTKLEIKFKSE